MSNPRCNYAARRFMTFRPITLNIYYDTLVMLRYSVCRSVCLTVQSHSLTVSDSETSYFFTLYNSPAILQFSYTEYYGKIPTAHIYSSAFVSRWLYVGRDTRYARGYHRHT